jgi:hypothetical protein
MRTFFLKSILLFFSISFLCSCTTQLPTEDEELVQLKSWMTGSFSSVEQSEADTNFFHIQLEMVQIWKDRTDYIWLYVEQSAAWAMDKPYRQRVYRLEKKEDGSFVSAVFTMEDPLRFTGVYIDENPLSQLTPDSLTERTGCAIYLQYEDGAFVGSTNESDCESNMRGASYATSEVNIQEQVLTSWDRGWNEEGEQVWGAETGPYIFKKLEDHK